MDTKLYKVRWFMLAFFFLMKSTSNFSYGGSGLINNFYVSYFEVSYVAADWTVLGCFIGIILVVPGLSVLVFLNILRIRRLVIIAASMAIVNYVLFLAALLNRHLFSVIVLSQIVSGIPGAAVYMVIGAFAALWFPEDQVGTAIGVAQVGTSVGIILGSIVLTHAMDNSLSYQSSSHNQSNTFHHNLTTNVDLGADTRNNLLKIYGVLLALSVCTLIFFIKFAKDVPSLPPTIAQALKREQDLSEQPKMNWKKVLDDSKALWTDSTFVLACLIFGIEYHMNEFEYTLLGEMFRDKNTMISSRQSTIIAGYTTTCFSVGACVGCFLAGFLVNRYKRYEMQTIIGSASSFVASVGFLIGFQYEILWLTMTSNALYGVSTRVSMIPLYDTVTQHTYPMDEIFASAWLTCFHALFGIVAAEVARLFYTYTGSLGVLILQSCSLFFVFLLSFFVKPKYKRLLADDITEDEKEERLLLKQENDLRLK